MSHKISSGRKKSRSKKNKKTKRRQRGRGNTLFRSEESNLQARVDAYIARGRDLNERYSREEQVWLGEFYADTLLTHASGRGYIDVFRSLINAGADVNQSTVNGDTPLIAATKTDQLEIVNVLVSLPNVDLNTMNLQGFSALHMACINRNAELVRVLLAAGANVNISDESNNTPLHTASDYGNIDVVNALIAAGADVNASTVRTERTFPFPSEVTPLQRASSAGRLEVVRALLAAGADVNRRDDMGRSPLFLAAHGNLVLLQVLLDAGADVNSRNNDGQTPLHNACLIYGCVEVVQALIASGADVNRSDIDGNTPLHVASEYQRMDVIQNLVAAGADVNRKDHAGRTPLYMASWNGYTEVVRALIAVGADVNRNDHRGRSPLEQAIDNDHTEVADLLRDAGARAATFPRPEEGTDPPKMKPDHFETCAKNENDEVECAITFETLTRDNAIMLPSASGNKQCFERSAIQEQLKGQRMHPMTRETIGREWINTWYPRGLDEVYDVSTGGKRKSKRKHRKVKKITKRKRTLKGRA
jgi:ankyrin repeat protein